MGNLFSVLSNDVEVVELEAFVSNFGTIKLLDPNFSSQTLLDGTYGYIVPGEFFFLNYNLFSTYYFKRLAMQGSLDNHATQLYCLLYESKPYIYARQKIIIFTMELLYTDQPLHKNKIEKKKYTKRKSCDDH